MKRKKQKKQQQTACPGLLGGSMKWPSESGAYDRRCFWVAPLLLFWMPARATPLAGGNWSSAAFRSHMAEHYCNIVLSIYCLIVVRLDYCISSYIYVIFCPFCPECCHKHVRVMLRSQLLGPTPTPTPTKDSVLRHYGHQGMKLPVCSIASQLQAVKTLDDLPSCQAL